MKFETNYPFVFVHGMMGFGKDDLINKFVPYWGMLSNNLINYIEDMGMEGYDPSIGKFSSAWDRACELYAQLVGGTVDYGVAHSKKYGHARFGRTYKRPLFEGWGPEKKINLVGHSFGGSTTRLFSTLMAYGSEEEIAATPADELSDFFKGGKADWIFSLTAVACVHEGTTLLYSSKKIMNKLEDVTYMLANISGDNLIGKIYESRMEQWGLIECKENGKVKSMPFDRAKQKKVKDSHDNVWYDLTLQGQKEVNDKIKCVPEIYYFSLPCCKTNQLKLTPRKQQVPQLKMCPLFWPMSYSIGHYSKNTVDSNPIDEHWLANDGLVPTISEKAPFNEPHMDLADAKGFKKGMWYVYDVINADHLGICGGFLPPMPVQEFNKIYSNHVRLICQLKK